MRTRPRILLSPRAEEQRQRLPPRLRHAVNTAIRRIADDPEWGATATEEGILPLRLLNPGRATPENSGLIADMSVQDGGLAYAIVYRIKDQRTCIWVEDIRPVMLG